MIKLNSNQNKIFNYINTRPSGSYYIPMNRCDGKTTICKKLLESSDYYNIICSRQAIVRYNYDDHKNVYNISNLPRHDTHNESVIIDDFHGLNLYRFDCLSHVFDRTFFLGNTNDIMFDKKNIMRKIIKIKANMNGWDN